MGVYRGHMWYKLDSDDGAWYWSDSEFVDSMNEGMSAPLPTPPAVLAQRELEARGVSTIFSMPFEAFLGHVRDARWTLEADEALVQLANAQCDDDGVSPRQLRITPPPGRAAHRYPAFFAGPDSLPLLRSRYALLLVLNKRLGTLLPLIDLSLSSNALISMDAGALVMTSALGRRFARLRGLVFTRVKREYWESVIEATIHYTQPPSDQFEHPDGFPEIKVRVCCGRVRMCCSRGS